MADVRKNADSRITWWTERLAHVHSESVQCDESGAQIGTQTAVHLMVLWLSWLHCRKRPIGFALVPIAALHFAFLMKPCITLWSSKNKLRYALRMAKLQLTRCVSCFGANLVACRLQQLYKVCHCSGFGVAILLH